MDREYRQAVGLLDRNGLAKNTWCILFDQALWVNMVGSTNAGSMKNRCALLLSCAAGCDQAREFVKPDHVEYRLGATLLDIAGEAPAEVQGLRLFRC